MSGTAQPPLVDPARDERLRERSREKIRYELAGAAKMGVDPDESWDVLQEGRDVLALLRQRDELLADAGRWQERTRYLLTTDPAEWEPEVIRWLT